MSGLAYMCILYRPTPTRGVGRRYRHYSSVHSERT